MCRICRAPLREIPRPDDDSAIAGGEIHVKVSRRPSCGSDLSRIYAGREWNRTTDGLSRTFLTIDHHYLRRFMSPIASRHNYAVLSHPQLQVRVPGLVRMECSLGHDPGPNLFNTVRLVVCSGPYCARDRSDCLTSANTRHSLLREI